MLYIYFCAGSSLHRQGGHCAKTMVLLLSLAVSAAAAFVFVWSLVFVVCLCFFRPREKARLNAIGLSLDATHFVY